MDAICGHLRLTVIKVHPTGDLGDGRWLGDRVSPSLPAEVGDPIPRTSRHHQFAWTHGWYEWGFAKQERLPALTPDVPVGVPAPVRLTEWKIKAIKLAVLLRKQESVTSAHFRMLDLSMTFFTQSHPRRLVPGKERGEWIMGTGFPDFQAQHPDVWAHTVETYESWVSDIST
tara:strand:- start:83360 stop:83875 length:516 start_codon:yes stop_codon:yes gene_type:complete